MPSFVAVYRGPTVAEARLIAVSADPALVADVSGRLLQLSPDESDDRVLTTLEHGKRSALRLIRREATHAP